MPRAFPPPAFSLRMARADLRLVRPSWVQRVRPNGRPSDLVHSNRPIWSISYAFGPMHPAEARDLERFIADMQEPDAWALLQHRRETPHGAQRPTITEIGAGGSLRLSGPITGLRLGQMIRIDDHFRRVVFVRNVASPTHITIVPESPGGISVGSVVRSTPLIAFSLDAGSAGPRLPRSQPLNGPYVFNFIERIVT